MDYPLLVSSNLPYRSRAVRAMVLLHEEHLRRFVHTWQQARAVPVILPPTADPNYASLDVLGRHVLSAARGYLVWICEVLRFPDPGVRPAPDDIAIVRDADGYMEHVFERWGAEALREISDEQLETPEYPSGWGTRYSTTHAFRRTQSGQSQVTPLSTRDWRDVQSSSFPMNMLRFGDFTGDGVTDVLAVQGGRWSISESGTGPWQRLNEYLDDDVRSLFIADLNNNNIDDLIRLERVTVGSRAERADMYTWFVSDDGRSPWRKLTSYTLPIGGSPVFADAGRFGAAPGGGVLLIDHNRVGNFYSEGEGVAGASPSWTSLFP